MSKLSIKSFLILFFCIQCVIPAGNADEEGLVRMQQIMEELKILTGVKNGTLDLLKKVEDADCLIKEKSSGSEESLVDHMRDRHFLICDQYCIKTDPYDSMTPSIRSAFLLDPNVDEITKSIEKVTNHVKNYAAILCLEKKLLIIDEERRKKEGKKQTKSILEQKLENIQTAIKKLQDVNKMFARPSVTVNLWNCLGEIKESAINCHEAIIDCTNVLKAVSTNNNNDRAILYQEILKHLNELYKVHQEIPKNIQERIISIKEDPEKSSKIATREFWKEQVAPLRDVFDKTSRTIDKLRKDIVQSIKNQKSKKFSQLPKSEMERVNFDEKERNENNTESLDNISPTKLSEKGKEYLETIAYKIVKLVMKEASIPIYTPTCRGIFFKIPPEGISNCIPELKGALERELIGEQRTQREAKYIFLGIKINQDPISLGTCYPVGENDFKRMMRGEEVRND